MPVRPEAADAAANPAAGAEAERLEEQILTALQALDRISKRVDRLHLERAKYQIRLERLKRKPGYLDVEPFDARADKPLLRLRESILQDHMTELDQELSEAAEAQRALRTFVEGTEQNPFSYKKGLLLDKEPFRAPRRLPEGRALPVRDRVEKQKREEEERVHQVSQALLRIDAALKEDGGGRGQLEAVAKLGRQFRRPLGPPRRPLRRPTPEHILRVVRALPGHIFKAGSADAIKRDLRSLWSDWMQNGLSDATAPSRADARPPLLATSQDWKAWRDGVAGEMAAPVLPRDVTLEYAPGREASEFSTNRPPEWADDAHWSAWLLQWVQAMRAQDAVQDIPIRALPTDIFAITTPEQVQVRLREIWRTWNRGGLRGKSVDVEDPRPPLVATSRKWGEWLGKHAGDPAEPVLPRDTSLGYERGHEDPSSRNVASYKPPRWASDERWSEWLWAWVTAMRAQDQVEGVPEGAPIRALPASIFGRIDPKLREARLREFWRSWREGKLQGEVVHVEAPEPPLVATSQQWGKWLAKHTGGQLEAVAPRSDAVAYKPGHAVPGFVPAASVNEPPPWASDEQWNEWLWAWMTEMRAQDDAEGVALLRALPSYIFASRTPEQRKKGLRDLWTSWRRSGPPAETVDITDARPPLLASSRVWRQWLTRAAQGRSDPLVPRSTEVAYEARREGPEASREASSDAPPLWATDAQWSEWLKKWVADMRAQDAVIGAKNVKTQAAAAKGAVRKLQA